MVGTAKHIFQHYSTPSNPDQGELMKRYFAQVMSMRSNNKKNKVGIVYPTDVSDMVRRSLGMKPHPFLMHWTKALRDLRI